ncbi:MAG: hypothetical protein JW829_19655 [Pirellulales bacterium]|nr:hypothetical protein [Pirellulales bacterium]
MTSLYSPFLKLGILQDFDNRVLPITDYPGLGLDRRGFLMNEPMVDIHCHLLPALDDGARSMAISLAMARMAVEDGISTILVTPHQLGNYSENRGALIRQRTAELAVALAEESINISILPGGDVRIDENLVRQVLAGNVLTLGDHGRHLLLELPHELYVPLEPLLDSLAAAGIVGILSHPERNAGILRRPSLVGPLVDRGCLMQVTAGSLTGSFGKASQQMAEWMLREGLVHFLATDAHSVRIRAPRLRPAFERTAQLVGQETAIEVCCRNPAAIAKGHSIPSGRRRNRQVRVLTSRFRGPAGGGLCRLPSAAAHVRWWPWAREAS